MTCQICNKESGEYSLCPECFELMQKGEIKQCANCKRWYRSGSICSCLKPKPAEKAVKKEKEQSDVTSEQSQKDYSKNSARGCLIALLTIASLFLCFPIISQRLENQGNTGEKTNIFTALFKDVPYIDTDYDLDLSTDGERIYLGFDVVVNCSANYNEVVAKIEFKDRSGAIFKTSYITFEDCKEGNVYRKKYNLSAEEILITDTVRCTLYKYT